jgi:hypothetical protein
VPLSGDCGFENVALTVIFIGDVFLGFALFEAFIASTGRSYRSQTQGCDHH